MLVNAPDALEMGMCFAVGGGCFSETSIKTSWCWCLPRLLYLHYSAVSLSYQLLREVLQAPSTTVHSSVSPFSFTSFCFKDVEDLLSAHQVSTECPLNELIFLSSKNVPHYTVMNSLL